MGHELPRVLHILAPAGFGGLESVVTMLAREWAARNAEVGVMLTLETGHTVPDGWTPLERAGVEVMRSPVAHRAYGREWGLYRDTLRQWKPEIVHCHGYRPDILAGWAASRLGLARVSTVHGFTGKDWKNRLYERLQIRALARFDAVVAVSRPIRDRLAAAGVPPSRIHVLPNALSTGNLLSRAAARQELGLPDNTPVLGWVGRMSFEKGLDVLLAALPSLNDLPLTVSVIGDGPLRESLQAEAIRLGVGDRIRWHGPVGGAARLYRAFDCFILSSRTEGTPIALLEAMAAGVPVVTAAVGGVPDVLGADQGLLVPAEDPKALSRGIRVTLTDAPAALQRANLARQRVSTDFAAASWVDQHAALYRDILAAKLGRSA
jgi:glycosyltransferase involved in cell wall biosynthesis